MGERKNLASRLSRRRSRGRHPVVITDIDFSDDIAITKEETEKMHFNKGRVTTIKAKNGEEIKSVDNLKYLGGWLESSAKDLKSERLWHGQLVTG